MIKNKNNKKAGFTHTPTLIGVSSRSERGFTLIEILIVIALIAILAGVVLVAINPARQFGQANNSQRSGNVNVILNAIGQYMIDNRGSLPASIGALADDETQTISKTGGIDLCTDLVPTYIPALPSDPKSGQNGVPVLDCSEDYNIGYEITKDADGRITVSAPLAELDEEISVTR